MVVEVVPRSNTKKLSPRAYEPVEDVNAARVSLRNTRKTT
jgi:hypothetical protein